MDKKKILIVDDEADIRAIVSIYLENNDFTPIKASNFKNLTLYLDTHKLLKNDEEIRLTPIEFKVLKLLWTNRGNVFSTEKIFEKVWGEQEFEVDNTVMVHIRNLREKIEDDNRKPQFIKTVWGVGYKFGE